MGGDMLNAMKYISTVPFSGLFNWSVQYLNDSRIAFSKAYPMMRIGEFLKRNKTAVAIEDDKTYKRATIKVRNGGIFLRDEEIGSKIGTKNQFLISKGQFLLSKIDARNGAFGVVPEVLDGGIITGNFWTFDVDYNIINPHYLALLTTTEAFVQFCEQASNGTTNRHYLQEPLFLNIKVPVPSLEEQNKLVKEYNKYITKSCTIDNQIKDSEDNIRQYITQSLYNSVAKTRMLGAGLGFTSFANTSKWGVEHLLEKQNASYKYPITTISKICKISSGGTPSRGNKEYYSGTIPWIKTGELQNNMIYDTEEHLTDLGIKNSSAKLYPIGSLVIAMYGATIGKTAMLGVPAATNQACAVLTEINSDLVISEYLWEYIKYHSDKLKSMAYGSAQPNINAGIIADLVLILPPIAIQKKMVKRIAIMRSQIEELHKKQNNSLDLALTNFETQIFE